MSYRGFFFHDIRRQQEDYLSHFPDEPCSNPLLSVCFHNWQVSIPITIITHWKFTYDSIPVSESKDTSSIMLPLLCPKNGKNKKVIFEQTSNPKTKSRNLCSFIWLSSYATWEVLHLKVSHLKKWQTILIFLSVSQYSDYKLTSISLQTPIEQNRCAVTCQGCGTVFHF